MCSLTQTKDPRFLYTWAWFSCWRICTTNKYEEGLKKVERKCWPEQKITKPTNCYMLQLSPINHFCLKGYVLRDWSNKINIGKNTYHRMDGWIKGSGFLCRSADDKYIIINSITRNTLKTKNCELIQFPIPDPWW